MTDDNDLMTLKTKVSDPAIATPKDTFGNEASGGDTSTANTQPPHEKGAPLMGIFAVGFGLLSIFIFAPLFVPLSLILGIIALFMGQVLLGISAIGLAIIGVLTSPVMMGIASLVAFWGWLGL